jgi:DNA-binding MarR family transcriptional regulator
MEKSKVGFIKFNVSLMNDYELKVGETLVYGALVSFRNMSIQSNTKDGQGEVYAYPPISSVANITGQSERSVKSHIQVLEQKGLMAVKRSYKEGSKEKNVNHYYLNTKVLKVYFSADATVSVKTAKPKTTVAKEKPKEAKDVHC